MGGNPIKAVSSGLKGIVSGGIGSTLGGLVMGPAGAVVGGVMGLGRNLASGSGGGSSAATVGGQQSPMDMLVNTGGAPLLANIAMGANVEDALASFLGVPKDQLSNIQGIDSLKSQLTSIQSNTNLKNQAVQKLVQDFPNYMQDLIPKYAGIADKYTQAAAQQALQSVGAKYAAGGQLSSGATMAALSRTGAENARANLNYGTQLAGQDWQNQFNEASALRNFQNTMLGNTANQGFNAVQNALGQNQQINMANAGFQNQQNLQNQQNQNSMWQAVGQLGGTALGGMFGGPAGAAIGGQVGQLATGQSGMMSNPRLNLGSGGTGLGRYY